MGHLRCDRNCDARPTRSTHSRHGTTQPDFQRRNRRIAGENSTQRPALVTSLHKPRIPRTDPRAPANPHNLKRIHD
ncbi:hypothetical protein NDU88_001475 [Pleurodeles waltl]|uniref:Uncharacterized protein n=1 Tax=Pleurodeles waltl TaxID=8319 RepID=A0AAV7R7C5_PLEWA|nr:hypothetical protein NDU88_001475 [Pleurodeles waltl]